MHVGGLAEGASAVRGEQLNGEKQHGKKKKEHWSGKAGALKSMVKISILRYDVRWGGIRAKRRRRAPLENQKLNVVYWDILRGEEMIVAE